MSTTRYKLTSVLPLPREIREKIYDDLDSSITINPQYPVNIRIAMEPSWSPSYESNPLHGINNIMNEEIKSRYYNTKDNAQTPFLPKKTTFRIWHRQSPLMKIHMDEFFAKNNNALGVRHLEYIFDNYDNSSETDDRFFATLARFSLLKTLKIVLNYEVGNTTGQDYESAKNWLDLLLRLARFEQNSELREWYHVEELKALNFQWEFQEGWGS